MDLDYRSALLQDRSKANIQRLADHIGEDPERFADLMRMVEENGSRASTLASWVMTTVFEDRPEMGGPWVGHLLKCLKQPQHVTLERHYLRSLQFCTIPKRYHGQLTDLAFGILADPSRAIASRAYAITLGMRMVQEHPDLGPELQQLIQDVLRVDPGPAIRSRAKAAVKQLGRSRR